MPEHKAVETDFDFCCLKSIGDPETPPMDFWTNQYSEISQFDPEIIVCRQDGESQENFVYRANTVANFMCGVYLQRNQNDA